MFTFYNFSARDAVLREYPREKKHQPNTFQNILKMYKIYEERITML